MQLGEGGLVLEKEKDLEKYQQPQICSYTSLMAGSEEKLESLDEGERGTISWWQETFQRHPVHWSIAF